MGVGGIKLDIIEVRRLVLGTGKLMEVSHFRYNMKIMFDNIYTNLNHDYVEKK